MASHTKVQAKMVARNGLALASHRPRTAFSLPGPRPSCTTFLYSYVHMRAKTWIRAGWCHPCPWSLPGNV